MRSSPRFWLALSLLLVAGAIVLWFKGRPEKSAAPVAWAQPQPTATQPSALLSMPSVAATIGGAAKKSENASASAARYQLKNVDQPIDALTRVQSAILMKNALIDTRQPIDLAIPADLRAGENPGSYIVQANGAPTEDFQKMLKAAGAEIVAYVPNNAFLVKAGADVAANLQNTSGVQAVLAYEPYYKLDTRLMKYAVDHETMADDAWLRVTLFPGASVDALAPLSKAVGPKEKSPFGEQVLIQPRAGVLADLAQLGEVQIIEPVNPRVVANDLTRVTLGVSEDTMTNANHFGLSGKDVWVNINDIGVDSNHPALAGRVFYYGTNATRDLDGHGTHVAGTIAGGHATAIFDKLNTVQTNSTRTNVVIVSDDDGNTTTNFFIDGSRTNADFRGIAHEAKLFVLPIDFTPDVNEPVSDTYLIETAASTNYFTFRRTNETLISNNSWNYANTTDYDSQAARFDAATRDALPDDKAAQPVLYVFAAGNRGFGGDDGLGGEPGTIASPGTAKNVITVGALESPRFIAEPVTNIEERVEIDDDGNTNTVKITNFVQIFRPATDSDNQVASYSSRGNVGIGVEGSQGRFKPDLVAPGTFIMSARSKDWNLTNDFDPGDTNLFEIFNVLSNLNVVSTKYRYDTGTSFSAPSVSGMLALLQEFFSHRLPPDRQRNLSPALMKALLINASRSINAVYDWNPAPQANYQGWGLVDLRDLITAADAPPGQPARPTLEVMPESAWPLHLIEQSATNAVATGEERVWNITVDTNALALPLRFTLVWTDPPGNPQVGVKLVNDLDLTVEVGGRVFHGNDFPFGSVITEPRDPRPGDELPIDDPFRDSINNVEKIVIGSPESLTETNGQPATTYKIRVSGRRVNVKSISDYYEKTTRTNEIVQDFALVFSADNTFITNAFPAITRVDKVTVTTNVFTQPIYNGIEATNQRSGANPPFYSKEGNSSQWRFYVFTNNDAALNAGFAVQGLKAGENVAFITSVPLNIGDPRNLEPDIDLYVSKNSGLTNLDPAVMNSPNTWRSTTRFGTETVVFAPDQFIRGRDGGGNLIVTTNTVQLYDPAHTDLGGVVTGVAKVDDVFYIGVKSEDQKAGDFSLIAISSNQPLEEERDGVRVIPMVPAPHDVPDGTPNLPQGRRYYGVPLRGGKILDASVYVAVSHEEFGDLVGTVYHNTRFATLNNHSLPFGFTNRVGAIYSDYPYLQTDLTHFNLEYPASLYLPEFRPTQSMYTQSDGPQTLSLYTSAGAMGAWHFDMVDSAASHTGSVHQVEMHVKPLRDPLIPGETIIDTVAGNSQDFYPLDVPNDATRVTVTLVLPGGANPDVSLLVRKDLIPSTNVFDYIGRFTSGGPNTVTVTFDRGSQPPLIPGEYIVGIVNNSASSVNYQLTVQIESDKAGAFQNALGDSLINLKDDARTITQGDLMLDRIVTDASVKIYAPNIRESDYVFRLTSPQGTSVILSENRGFMDQTGFGSSILYTNADGLPTSSYVLFTDLADTPVKFALPPFGDSSATRGPVFSNSFENVLEGTYAPGQTLDGWAVRSNNVYAIWGDAADGNMFVNLGMGGAITNILPTIKGRPYKLSFAYRGKPSAAAYSLAGDFSHVSNPNSVWTYGYRPAFGSGFTKMTTVAKIASNPDVWFWQGLPGQVRGEPTIGKNEGTTAWTIGGTTTYRAGEVALHPGPNGEKADLRWTAPSAGAYQLAATFKGGDLSTSTDVHIEVDGVQVFSAFINDSFTPRTLTTNITVSAGSVIDFIVGPNGRYEFDTTIVSVTITSPLGGVFSTGQIDDGGTHTNLTSGAVDRHFRVINNPDPNFAPPPGQDGSQLFVADTNTPPFPTWFANDLNSQWLALKPQNDAGHPAGLYTNRTSFVLTGVNPADVYVRARIAGDDITQGVLVNNVSAPGAPAGRTGYSTPFILRGFRIGLNTIDFVVSNMQVGPEGFRADLSMGLDANRSGQLALTNNTMGFVRLTSSAGGSASQFSVRGGGQWERFETEFIAPSDNMAIEFFARANLPGVDIDDVTLEDTGNKIVQPEEPLEILLGERAMGEWKLEAIDSRTKGVVPSVIQNWELMLGIATPPRMAEPLAANRVYPAVINNPVIAANTNVYTPGKILGGETEYFYFDVCDEATDAIIELFGPKTNTIALELLVDRSGFPTGDPETDDYAIVRTTPGVASRVTVPITLTQPIAAPLRPGKRLFIAVRGSQFPLTTNETFQIRVLPNGCKFDLPQILGSGATVSSAAFPASAGDDGTTYQTATNATSVDVTVDGTLTFLAANGFVPTPDNYQIKQVVSHGKVTIPLTTRGVWYFRIINESGATVSYTLTVSDEPPSSIRTVAIVNDHLTVTWQSVPGTSYEIATSTDLVNWTTVTTVQATTTETTYNDPNPAGGTMRFIRIRPL